MKMLVTTSDYKPTFLCLQAGNEDLSPSHRTFFERMIQVASTGPTQTLALLPGSLAIDTVPSQACSITVTDVSGHTMTITTDQRGVPRLHGLKNACDSGAYESS